MIYVYDVGFCGFTGFLRVAQDTRRNEDILPLSILPSALRRCAAEMIAFNEAILIWAISAFTSLFPLERRIRRKKEERWGMRIMAPRLEAIKVDMRNSRTCVYMSLYMYFILTTGVVKALSNVRIVNQ